MAMVPIAAHSSARLTRLALERKNGLSTWNTAQMMARPTTTGSDPRSPLLTRAMNAFQYSAEAVRA